MKRILPLIIILLGWCGLAIAQPYLMPTPGNGLGQYGYVEKDFSSFTVINTDNNNNVYNSRTRYYVDGVSVVYEQNSPTPPGCYPFNSLLTCPDYNPGDFGAAWQAGNIMYVSSQLQYHDGGFCTDNPTGWSHAESVAGFNERSFRIIDIEEVPADISPTLNNDGSDNVVLSFTIDPGGISGLSLIRLWVYNDGAAPAAQETEDLPNEMRLYYENVTGGTDEFDGTESFDALWGDWGGDATTNEVWGNDNISGGSGISIPAGGLKCYLVFDALPVGFNVGRNTAIRFINDGMSLLPARDVSYTLVRLGESDSYPAVLPITLSEFTAVASGANQATLDWKTESEINNSHFDIEHSADGKEWIPVGKVDGNGTTTLEHEYSFIHNNAISGINYYRLKQVDYDGFAEWSDIRAVQISSANVAFWPNPTSDVLYIAASEGIAELYSVSGKLVHTSVLPTGGIDVSSLSKGTYLLRITNNEAVQTQAVVIE